MRTPLLFSLFLAGNILLALPAHSQKAFLDAQAVKALLPIPPDPRNDAKIILPDNPALYPILKNYVTAAEAATPDGIKAAFAKNPFMGFDIRLGLVEPERQPFSILSPSSIGGLDVTDIANGVATLMIQRAKQELTIVFFDRFRQFTKDHPEISILFPVTTANLGKLLTYSYPQMLPVLRNGFFADLRQLPVNLPAVLDLPQYQNLLANLPQLRMAIRSLKIVREIQTGASTPPDVLVEIAGFPEWDAAGRGQAFKNVGSAVKFAALFSQSLRSADDEQGWLLPKDIKPMLLDIPLANLYLGLLWEGARTGKIMFYPKKDLTDPVPLSDLIATLKGNTGPVLDRVSAFIALAGQIRTALNTITTNNAQGKANSDADYYNYIGVALDALDSAFGLVRIFNRQLNVEPYFAIARNANSLYKDIYSHQYSQAVSDALDICGGIGALVEADEQRPLLTADAGQPDRDAALKNLSALAEKLKPYALFMANMVEAKSSAEVTATLDNAILPVGSSSIKKNTTFNLSIQAYLGAFDAFSTPSTGTAIGTWSDRFGVSAPIGLSLTPCFLSWGKSGSGSLFVPLFDLGAIVDYQLRNDTTINSSGNSTSGLTKSYSVKLGQILSPGIYFVYGFFGHLPLALGVGGQYGPGLSKIGAGASPQLNSPRWRGAFFLSVDLPFFTLINHTKPTN